MTRLRWMRLLLLLGVMAAIGIGAGLALAQGPEGPGEVEATAHEVDCQSMPDMTPEEAAELNGCYVVEVQSAPPEAGEIEVARAKAAALCGAVAEPAERPDACQLFDFGGAG